jgi:hypothetical protein
VVGTESYGSGQAIHFTGGRKMKISKLILRWVLFAPLYVAFAAAWMVMAWLFNETGWWAIIRDDFKKQFLAV